MIARAVLERIEEHRSDIKWFNEIDNLNLTIAGVGLSAKRSKQKKGFIWGEARGVYNIEDEQTISLILESSTNQANNLKIK